ncbi:hypothetical protein [Naumannella huperziae]
MIEPRRDRRRYALPVIGALLGLVVVAVVVGYTGGFVPRPAGRTLAQIGDVKPIGRPVTWAGLYRDDFAALADRVAEQGRPAEEIRGADPMRGFLYAHAYDACGYAFDGWRFSRGGLEPAMIDLGRNCVRPQYAVVVTWFDWSELPGEFTVRGTPVRR